MIVDVATSFEVAFVAEAIDVEVLVVELLLEDDEQWRLPILVIILSWVNICIHALLKCRQ